MMRRRVQITFHVVGLAMGLSACQLEPQGTPPAVPEELTAETAKPGDGMTHDDVLEAIEDEVPGFGGLYVDDNGSIVVYHTSVAEGERAKETIRAAIRRAGNRGLTEFGGMSEARMVVRAAKYTFKQLATWRRQLYAGEILAGTVLTGVDKRNNRLIVAVASSDVRDKWRKRLASTGIDHDAVRYEVMEHPVPHLGLRDRVRPTVAGLQLTIVKQTKTSVCTLGANVLYAPSPGNRYFVTASHCSTNMWALDAFATQWHQPSLNNLIATGEARDPAPFSGGACPAGRVCRYGDVTLVRYTNAAEWSLGRVAFAGGAPTFTISGYRNIVAQPFIFFEFPGMWKTGRSTGTTAGGGGNFCVDFHPNQQAYATVGVTIGPNWTMLCQTISVPWQHLGGDSGAPVFGKYLSQPASEVFLDGIFHAGSSTTFIYSPLPSVAAYDFGGLFNLQWY